MIRNSRAEDQRGLEPDEQGADANAEGGAERRGGAQGAAGDPSQQSLQEQIAKLSADKEDLLNTLVRRQADFENYRKRIEKERQEDRHRAAAAVLEQLFPVLDAFDRALQSSHDRASQEYRKGFELIYKQLWEVLSKQGLQRINAEGKRFDPRYHHAIERVESREHPEDVVTEELQAGYMHHDKVLRPAMVRVAALPAHKTREPE